MDRKEYVILIGGVGYLGYNLTEQYVKDGVDVLVISRKRSIVKRPFLFQRLRKFGIRFYIEREITPESVENVINRFGEPKLIYYLAGISRGSTDVMKYVHGTLSYRIAYKIFSSGLYSGRYVHVSAYNPGRILSGYIESKVFGEELLRRLKGLGYPVTILRPGLLVGRYPYHPEWRHMYQIARMGIAIETNIIMGYTPIKEIYEFVKFMEERGIHDENPIDLTLYSYDIGLITRVFARQAGFERPTVIRIHSPRYLWKILPYHGTPGFLRGFIYPHNPPRPIEVYRMGYRARTNLIKELVTCYNDLKIIAS